MSSRQARVKPQRETLQDFLGERNVSSKAGEEHLQKEPYCGYVPNFNCGIFCIILILDDFDANDFRCEKFMDRGITLMAK